MKYKFDEIAINCTKKKQPTDTDRKTYIGLEHIDPENFTISRWGSDITPTGEKLVMEKGDILFGKRRAYQRKVAIAPFNGIFSAHGMVLRPKTNVIDSAFFPFFIASDQFMETAVRISVGGLSPTINWKDLKTQEFEIPPLEEQKILADKLWAAYRLKEAYMHLLIATDEMVKSQFIEMFGNPVSNDRIWECEPISSIAPESPATHIADNQVWLLNLDMIESGTGNIVEKVFVSKENVLYAQPFDEGNVLFSKLRPYLNKVVCPNGKGYATTELVALRPKQDKLNQTFFTYLLRSDQFVQFANDISGGTKMPRMPLKELREFKCILPPIKLQEEFATIVHQADKSKFELKKAIEAIDQVIKSLING